MSPFPFSSLCYLLALSCGLVAAISAPHKERQLRSDPLHESWENEEVLAILLNDKIEESKAKSPTLSPIVSDMIINAVASQRWTFAWCLWYERVTYILMKKIPAYIIEPDVFADFIAKQTSHAESYIESNRNTITVLAAI